MHWILSIQKKILKEKNNSGYREIKVNLEGITDVVYDGSKQGTNQKEVEQRKDAVNVDEYCDNKWQELVSLHP